MLCILLIYLLLRVFSNPSSPLKSKLHEGKGICLLYSLLYPHDLERCLAQRQPINISQFNVIVRNRICDFKVYPYPAWCVSTLLPIPFCFLYSLLLQCSSVLPFTMWVGKQSWWCGWFKQDYVIGWGSALVPLHVCASTWFSPLFWGYPFRDTWEQLNAEYQDLSGSYLWISFIYKTYYIKR